MPRFFINGSFQGLRIRIWCQFWVLCACMTAAVAWDVWMLIGMQELLVWQGEWFDWGILIDGRIRIWRQFWCPTHASVVLMHAMWIAQARRQGGAPATHAPPEAGRKRKRRKRTRTERTEKEKKDHLNIHYQLNKHYFIKPYFHI